MKETYEKLNILMASSETDPFTPDRYCQFYRHFLPNTKFILDVGCSTGRGGIALKQLNNNLNIIGLDCVSSRLDNLSKGDIYSDFICSYSTSISAKDSSFDVIVAGEFVEHLYIEDVEQTLKEFYRIIKPGGQLMLTTPNPDYFRLKLTGGSVLGGAHVSQHYPKQLKKDLENIGFRNIKICGSGKMSRIFGEKFPFFNIYGSYLIIGIRA